MNELLFTPVSLLDLLTQIEELRDLDISISESSTGVILNIGASSYTIKPDDPVDVSVDPESLEEIDDACEDVYEDLGTSEDVVISREPVESGIIKEVLKTLLIGGMVRLGKKLLK